MQRSAGVKETLQRFYDAFTANDLKAFEDGVLATQPEATAIGRAPHEWHSGRDKLLREFGMEGVTLRGADAETWEEGTVRLVRRPRDVHPARRKRDPVPRHGRDAE